MAVSAIAAESRMGSAGRLLPLGGIAFVALVVIAFAGLSSDTPGAEDSAAVINTFYDAHHGREIIALVGGSALAGAAWIFAAVIHFALADAADQHGMAGGALQALNVLDADSWIAFNSGMGVLLLAAGGALLARKVLPVLAWIALATGILLFIPYADFFGLIISGLWVITMSVVLYRRGPAFAAA
jgi:hypothetical protein